MIGALDRTTQTTKQIEQVIDQTTGEVKENVVSTTDVVTDSYTAMVDGVAQTVERTTTYVNGIVTDVQEKTTGLKTEIKGIQGTVGSFSQFILDLDTKLGGLEKAASNLSKSPLGTWFSDLKKDTGPAIRFSRTSTLEAWPSMRWCLAQADMLVPAATGSVRLLAQAFQLPGI